MRWGRVRERIRYGPQKSCFTGYKIRWIPIIGVNSITKSQNLPFVSKGFVAMAQVLSGKRRVGSSLELYHHFMIRNGKREVQFFVEILSTLNPKQTFHIESFISFRHNIMAELDCQDSSWRTAGSRSWGLCKSKKKGQAIDL